MAQETPKELIFDIEANGLRPSRVHCWSVEGGGHGTDPASFQKEVLNKCDTLVGHNILGYDLPVMERLWGLDFSTHNVVDTLVLSRLARPDREGHPKPHSLEAWGQRLGYPKVEHEDWDEYTPEMKVRCDTDVELNERVLYEVRKELQGFSEDSIKLEHDVFRIIEDQMSNGWQFDDRAAVLLSARLRDEQRRVEREVHKRFTPLAVENGTTAPKWRKDGSLSKVGTKFLGDAWETLAGLCTRITFPEFNLGSNPQIARYLQRFGWKPRLFTDKGAAVVDEGTLKYVKIPEAQLILEYKNLGKLSVMVESWLEAQQEDGRIYGYVNSCGAVTGRMSHSSPNLAQVPSRSELGKECRELFTVKGGYTLVGMDASGLELRMLAHYMKDADYLKEVVSGDVHTVNQKAAGLATRDEAKPFIYAYLYGAGDALVGEICGTDSAGGRKIKARFLAKTPALANLKDRVERAARRGYLVGLDGRHIRVRNIYSALNTLLQGAGAVVMKRALVILNHKMRRSCLDAHFVGNIHDEIQAEVKDEHVAIYSRMAEDAMREAGEYYKMRCPLAGEAKHGKTWRETH